MTKRKKGKIIVLMVILVIVSAIVIFSFSSPKEETLIKEFVNTWLIDYEANQEIYNFSKESSKYVNTAEEAEKSRQEFGKVVKKHYQKYLTDSAQEIFSTEILPVFPHYIYRNYKTCDISKCVVQKDNSVYKVNITLNLSGGSESSHNMIVKVQMKDGKINWLEIVEGGDIQ